MREVILIAGPPCSGKTTLAHELATDHEIVDYDELAGGHGHGYDPDIETEVQRRLDRIAADPDARAIVIRSAPRADHRDELATHIGATRRLLLLTEADECRARAHGRPSGTRRQIGLWWWRYEPSDDDEIVDAEAAIRR